MGLNTFSQLAIPLLERRGGCASNKMSRRHRSGADGVVAREPNLKNAFQGLACERPPRPLQQRWLRGIFLGVASSPPREEGITAPDPNVVHSFKPSQPAATLM